MPRKDKLRQEKVKIGQKNPKKIFAEFFVGKLRQKGGTLASTPEKEKL